MFRIIVRRISLTKVYQVTQLVMYVVFFALKNYLLKLIKIIIRKINTTNQG